MRVSAPSCRDAREPAAGSWPSGGDRVCRGGCHRTRRPSRSTWSSTQGAGVKNASWRRRLFRASSGAPGTPWSFAPDMSGVLRQCREAPGVWFDARRRDGPRDMRTHGEPSGGICGFFGNRYEPPSIQPKLTATRQRTDRSRAALQPRAAMSQRRSPFALLRDVKLGRSGCHLAGCAPRRACAGTSHAEVPCRSVFVLYRDDYVREQLSNVSLSSLPRPAQFFASGPSFPLSLTSRAVSRPMKLLGPDPADLTQSPAVLRMCLGWARPTWDSVFRLFACTVRTDLTKSRRKWS